MLLRFHYRNMQIIYPMLTAASTILIWTLIVTAYIIWIMDSFPQRNPNPLAARKKSLLGDFSVHSKNWSTLRLMTRTLRLNPATFRNTIDLFRKNRSRKVTIWVLFPWGSVYFAPKSEKLFRLRLKPIFNTPFIRLFIFQEVIVSNYQHLGERQTLRFKLVF